jgi:hypothetical protein
MVCAHKGQNARQPGSKENAQMSETNVVTPKARLAFPALFEPRGFNGNTPKFSCVLVFDKAAQETA